MPTVNALEIKEKMISILNQKGPSLPVHIAKETDLSILFASAFLSELIADKRLKVSSMKVGNSPLYLIPGHESMLENFSDYLKGKEKEAFNLIKEKKFLKDSEMEPAIRVAIREIKDFAIQFKMEGEIYWRYLTENESDFISARFKESETPKVFHKIQVVEKQPAVVEKAKEEKKKFLEDESKFVFVKAKVEDYDYARKLESEHNFILSFFDCIHIAICQRLGFFLVTRDKLLMKIAKKVY